PDGADGAGQEGQARQTHLHPDGGHRPRGDRAECRARAGARFSAEEIGGMSSVAINLTLAVLLLAANAFYVAAEFALVKSRGFRVRAMVEQNRFGARLLQSMMDDIEAYLACCQLGITMASLGLGWVGEPTVAGLLQPVLEPLGMPASAMHFTAFVTGFLVFSSLHIVIGEQVPKTLAIREPVPVSQWIAYPLYVSFLVLYPLNWLLNAASRAVLRMLGVQESSQNE